MGVFTSIPILETFNQSILLYILHTYTQQPASNVMLLKKNDFTYSVVGILYLYNYLSMN